MPTLRPRKRHPQAPAAAHSSQPEGPATTTSFVPTSETSKLRKFGTPMLLAGERRHPDEMSLPDEETPLLDGQALAPEEDVAVPSSPASAASWAGRNQWILFALASGACAAFNGVFAKLTTTELTSKFSAAVARLLGLGSARSVVEFLVRCTFFGLNLAFNGVMWTLFTTALARGNSTTQVSIMNTSSNFVITAILGLAIFSEALPPLWWLGAAMLVAGNVIIGRKDEGMRKEDGREDGEGDNETPAVTPGSSRPVAGMQVDRNAEGEEKEEDAADLGVLEGTE